MKLQDCFIGQNVGVTSKSMGVVTGIVEDIFETQDVDTEEPSWYAVVNVEHLEHNLEIKDINKRILDNMEESSFNITLYEAGWYQQAMQYFERCYLKNGLEDLEKGIVTMQFVVDSMKERLKNE